MKDFSKYKLNVKKSPPDLRDWKAKHIYRVIKLPDSLNYRPDMLPVLDQGNQGSCVAMAGAAMKEWQEKKDIGLNEYMSPQFIYNNREDPNEEGMTMRDLMKILQKLGDCKEKDYPYGSINKIPPEIYELALNFKVKNYAAVETIDELKSALYLNGPCIFAVPVYNFGTRMWKRGMGEGLLGGHGLCNPGYLAVGYNQQGFIIRNSWGSDWGDKGYCIFPYEDWGLQWEIWTTIDENSFKPGPTPPEPDKKNWIEKYWWTIVLGVIAIGTVIILLLT